MRILGLVLLTAGLALASPALASDKGAPPRAAPAPSAPSDDLSTQLVTEIVRYSGEYQAVLGEASQYFSDFMTGVNQNLGPGRIDKARADAWIADSRTRLNALKARRAALGPPPASLIKRLNDAGMGSEVAPTRDMGQKMGEAIDAVLDLCDKVLGLAPAVAQGDASAQAQMLKAMQKGTRTALLSENAMMAGGLAGLDPGHPQGAILRSITASNTALIALLDVGQQIQDDPKADITALVKRFREYVAKARVEGLAAGPLASRAIVQIQAGPGDEALKARVVAAMGTYAESGNVEVQIAGILEGLVEADTDAKSKALDDELQSLVGRRLKLQNDRQTLIAG